MAIAFVASADAVAQPFGQVTVSKPTGTLSGHVLVAQVTTANPTTITAPSGWTTLQSGAVGGLRYGVWVKVAGGSEPSSYTFQFSATVNAVAAIATYSGVAASPIDVSGSQTGSSTTLTAPSVTTSGNALVLSLFGAQGVDVPTAPSGTTSRVARANTSGSTLRLVDAAHSPASATTARESTIPTSLDWAAVTVALREPNTTPNAPTLTFPASNATLDRAITQRFAWTFSDPDAGDTQSAFSLRYRLVGAGTWTTVTGTTPNSFRDFAPATFAAGDYEWQVSTTDALGLVGPYSGLSFYTAANAPAGPTITDPINGSTVSTETYTATVSYSSWDSAEWQVVDAAAVVVASGTLTAAQRTFTATGLVNGSTVTWRVRAIIGGLAGSWTEVTTPVSYTPPAAPSITITSDDAAGSLAIAITVGSWPVTATAVTQTGTGTGTMTGPTATAGTTDTRTWTATLVTAAANGGTFDVAKNGVVIGQAIVGAQFTHEGLAFTINDGATDFALGDRFAWSTTAIKTISHDVYRRETAVGGDGIRIRKQAGSTVTDYTPASGVDYEYRATSNGDNGTSATGPWTGAATPIITDTYGAY